jgi:hypothetical protein
MRILLAKFFYFLRDFFRHFLLGGPVVLFDFIRNKTNSWNLSDLIDYSDIPTRGTSLSDTPAYVRICDLASQNVGILEKFKSEVNYMRILEHVDYPLGRRYLQEFKNNPQLVANLKKVSSREIGRPKKYHYPKLGRVSPTQLRYAKILGDLIDLFGDLDGFSIAEIGVGNGGQSLHLVNMYRVSEYTYFDLPEVQRLVERILEIDGVEIDASFPDIFSLTPETYDLVIANYSFSELRIEDQQDYMRNIMMNSKRGYLILNDIKPYGQASLNASDLLRMIPGSQILPEKPLSHSGNQLLVWGHQPQML